MLKEVRRSDARLNYRDAFQWTANKLTSLEGNPLISRHKGKTVKPERRSHPPTATAGLDRREIPTK